MKVYEEMEVQPHSLLTSGVDSDDKTKYMIMSRDQNA